MNLSSAAKHIQEVQIIMAEIEYLEREKTALQARQNDLLSRLDKVIPKKERGLEGALNLTVPEPEIEELTVESILKREG